MFFKIRIIRSGIFFLAVFCLFNISYTSDFKQQQLQYPRVREAYKEKENLLKKFFDSQDIEYPPERIFIRAFKKEQFLELWAWSSGDSVYKLIKSFSICALSGQLGPKRKEGDRQIPEGLYHINHFNPYSNYFLSLKINYPNKSDLILGDKKEPGGLIFIHGNCVTIGCIPIRDNYIKELYIATVEAKNNGQEKIPVHIFPCRLSDSNLVKIKSYYNFVKIHKFWDNLKPFYDYFERHHRLPGFTVDGKGRYRLLKRE